MQRTEFGPWADAGTYAGEFNKAGRRDGRGTFTWRDGSRYEGRWKDDEMHGNGTFTWPNGDVYAGPWRHNAKQNGADCTYRLASGEVYEIKSGSWSRDVIPTTVPGGGGPNGPAKLPSGTGTGTTITRETVSGSGTIRWPDGSLYDGQISASLMDGRGSYQWPDGDLYDGGWRAGLRHGAGTCRYTNGDVFVGSYSRGLKEGAGILILDGLSFRGSFTGGMRNGSGLFAWSSGKTLACHWRDDGPDPEHPGAVVTSADGKTVTTCGWKVDPTNRDPSGVLLHGTGNQLDILSAKITNVTYVDGVLVATNDPNTPPKKATTQLLPIRSSSSSNDIHLDTTIDISQTPSQEFDQVGKFDDIPHILYPTGFFPKKVFDALVEAEIPEILLVISEGTLTAQKALSDPMVSTYSISLDEATAISCITCPRTFLHVNNRLNSALLQRNTLELKKWSSFMFLLLRGIRKLPTITATAGGVFYRSIKTQVNVDQYHYCKGNNVAWHCFSTVGTRLEDAMMKCRNEASEECSGTMFILENCWGYDVSLFGERNEILLEPEIAFSVREVKIATLIMVEMVMQPSRLLLERLVPALNAPMQPHDQSNADTGPVGIKGKKTHSFTHKKRKPQEGNLRGLIDSVQSPPLRFLSPPLGGSKQLSSSASMTTEPHKKTLIAFMEAVPYLQEREGSVYNIWKEWFETIPMSEVLRKSHSLGYSLSSSVDWKEHSFYYFGPQSIVTTQISAFAQATKTDATSLECGIHFQGLDIPILGLCIRLTANGAECGWYSPDDVPLGIVLKVADPGVPLDIIFKWCNTNKITQYSFVGHGIGSPPVSTKFQFQMPCTGFQQQLKVAMRAWKFFNFPPLSPQLIACLTRETAQSACVSITFTNEQFISISIDCKMPSKTLISQLSAMVRAKAESVSMLEGISGKPVSMVSYCYLCSGSGGEIFREGYNVFITCDL
ncbi:phosphatidylinositol-4-phosphate 5-kinase [Pelomyxa schiedti]|nr:phosphatidylinositol-4-phosphate 5-kinase [Pelomyxa schiedti]